MPIATVGLQTKLRQFDATQCKSPLVITMLANYFQPNGPGAALAVVRDGQHPHIECIGMADVERKRAITGDTVFDLASASKPFTAAAVMLLVERGELNLEAPFAHYLPEMAIAHHHRPISLIDLLWHTSDLTDYLESGVYAKPEEVTIKHIHNQLPGWSQQAKPGRQYNYCNTNYVILASVIEAVTGTSFTAFVRENILQPLGLDNTFLPGDKLPADGVAKGYQVSGFGLPLTQATEDFVLDTQGDGGVYSSLSDLIHWQSRFWQGDIVTQQSLKRMQTPGKLDSGETFEYGLGLQIEQRDDGAVWVGHGGSWTNSTVMVGRYPQQETTIIVLSNEVMAPVERLSQRAFESVL